MRETPVTVMQLISSLEVGGSEKLLVELLQASRDDDRMNFIVVVMNQSVNPEMQQALERLGLPTYYLDRPEGHRHLKYLLALWRIVVRHRVNIIHAHNRGSKFWGLLSKLVRPGARLVFTIHDTMMLPRLRASELWLHRNMIDCHIAISKTVQSLCDQRGIENTRQIYNGIPLSRFEKPKRMGLEARLGQRSFQNLPLQILHIGRMEAAVKGQDVLIEAIRRCRDAGLHVHARLMGGVCAYNREAFEALQAQVRAYRLENQIEFLPNRTDVPEMLEEADLFVLPSRAEGLGLVLLEAMAAGVPVIASDIGGPKEIIEHTMNGLLFEAGNGADLAEKIRFIYEHPEAADVMRIGALHFVQPFDIHMMKRQYYRLYEDLMMADEKLIFQGWRPERTVMSSGGRLGDGASF